MSVPGVDLWKQWLSRGDFVQEADREGSPADDVRYAECIAPTNIAVIKYWGKRDEKLILPINSSLSATLNTKDLCTRTIVVRSSHFKENLLWLNGNVEKMTSSRMANCLEAIRARANGQLDGACVHIWTENSFPTAAGLASSASGFACLVYTMAQLFGVVETYPGELSLIARQGSGSACRSLYGGFVKWVMGNAPDGSDSIAVQVAPESHWPDMEMLICVVSDEKKSVSSTSGMMTSVETSKLLEYRAKNVVEPRMAEMEDAIQRRDFDKFAELTMRDSNQFHATCLDTYPPIFYMNDVSRSIVNLVHMYNKGGIKAAYTFDAGPNAVIYIRREHVQELLSILVHAYKPEGVDAPRYVRTSEAAILEACNNPSNDAYSPFRNAGAVKEIIHTSVGPGPQRLDA